MLSLYFSTQYVTEKKEEAQEKKQKSIQQKQDPREHLRMAQKKLYRLIQIGRPKRMICMKLLDVGLLTEKSSNAHKEIKEGFKLG